MFLIPISTDAPIYHRPVGTVGLILVNVLVFGLTVGDLDSAIGTYGLHHGAGLTPLEWVSSNFIHGGVIHLLGNMIFLWGFGLVVEGKIGSLQFIPLYLGIGVLECLLEQILFFQSEGVTYGASAIIFGLMVIALLWAPQNELTVFYWLFFRFVGVFDISIVVFAILKLLLSLFVMTLLFLMEKSGEGELLHLMGAGIGGIVGVVYLKAKLVDCEGWDIFSVMAGTTPSSEPYLSESFQQARRRRMNTRKAKRKRSFDPDPKPQLSKASPERFEKLLRQKKATAAWTELARIRHRKPEWSPQSEQLLLLARGLRTASKMKDAVTVYSEFLEQNPEQSVARLELAEIFVFVQERPSAALKLLNSCHREEFTDKQKQRHQQATLHANSMLESGIIEIDFQE